MIDMAIEKGRKINVYTGNVRPAFVLTGVTIVVHMVAMAIMTNGVDEINLAFWLVNLSLFILYMLFSGIMVFQATQVMIIVHRKISAEAPGFSVNN